jgi:hypothetical protein
MMQFSEERHRDDLRANYRKVHDGGMGCCSVDCFIRYSALDCGMREMPPW